MSGICGYIDFRGKLEAHVIDDMVKSLKHRGPDSKGALSFNHGDAIIALGCARLAVNNLTDADRQPMTFCGMTIVFDGEVYNYKEIRCELEGKGHQFFSNTDTEVVLHAFYEWGERSVNKFIGMFAFVIYDESGGSLFLCRDRAGVKPLFYHIGDGFFAFASELRALMIMPCFKREVSPEAISVLLKLHSIPEEMAIFKNTFKLNGGHWLTYRIDTGQMDKRIYWDIEHFYELPKLQLSYEDAKAELKSLLKSAINNCLVSDVPVGGFLSGGIDSSLVTSLQAGEIGMKPKVFTIGFGAGTTDEAPVARQTADVLGVEHFIKYCNDNDALSLVESIPCVYDEPCVDPSTIPTLFVSRFAKEYVQVVMSADGGDHLFAGFDWYDHQIKKIGNLSRRSNGRGLGRYRIPLLIARALLPCNRFAERSRLDILSGISKAGSLTYKVLNDNMRIDEQSLVNYIYPAGSHFDCRCIVAPIGTNEAVAISPEYAVLSDFKIGLKDEVLVKMERASMSVSLEVREPMLDHRIAEFAAQLPWEYKCQNGVKKRILRDILHEYLPKEITDRPKSGFGPPMFDWLRGCLKSMIYDILTVDKLKEMGFSGSHTRRFLDTFMKGDPRESYGARLVWSLLQYGLWYNHWIGEASQ